MACIRLMFFWFARGLIRQIQRVRALAIITSFVMAISSIFLAYLLVAPNFKLINVPMWLWQLLFLLAAVVVAHSLALVLLFRARSGAA